MLERHAGASLISRRGAKGGRLGIGLSAGITIQTRRPSCGCGQRWKLAPNSEMPWMGFMF